MMVEQNVFNMLHGGQQADVGSLVRVLVSDGPTSAFSFGVVDTLE